MVSENPKFSSLLLLRPPKSDNGIAGGGGVAALGNAATTGGGADGKGGANASSAHRGADLKLYCRDVRDRQGKKRCLTVRSWATIKDVKDQISHMLDVPPAAQRLYFGPLLTSGKELPNHRTLQDAGIYRSGETLLLDIIKRSGGSSSGNGSSMESNNSMTPSSLRSNGDNDVCISSSMIDSTPKPLRYLVTLSRRAFCLGLKPELCLDGSGGTYYMHDARKAKVAVFKPADEEPYAVNNPRGYLPHVPGQPDSLREGVAPGEACIREVAAFLLDHDGFANVPMTTLAEARHPAFHFNGKHLTVAEGGASIGSHSITSSSLRSGSSPNNTGMASASCSMLPKKVGSFQEYVRSECSMDDISPSMLSVSEVHKIAILDIRLMNADRNGGNLLCRRLPHDNSFELVPIDHGYCLRSVCDVSWMDWCWLDWPQLKQPVSKEHKKYIENLDIESDVRILEERLNICQEALDNFRASSALLKAGVKNGMTLHEIAVMCCRNDNLAEQPSLLERLTSMAAELAQTAVQNDQWHHTTASRALAEQLTPKRSGGDRFVKARDFRRSASSAEFTYPSLEPGDRMEADDDDDDDDSLFGSSKDVMKKQNQRANINSGDGGSGGSSSQPAMIQSSGSDSSTDADGMSDPQELMPDKGEVEEWAHNLIEDSFVMVHDVPSPATRVTCGKGGRSSSVTSDDGSSDSLCSPKGFWHVRPGAVNVQTDCMSDDGSFSWSSPHQSPRPVSCVDEPLDMDAAAMPPPAIPPSSPMQESKDSKRQRRQSVKFADLPPNVSGPFIPPATVMMPTVLEPPPMARQDSGMKKSKSYSALSRTFSSSGSGSERTNDDPINVRATMAAGGTTIKQRRSSVDDVADSDAYRTYFLKFIDLVIVREMTRVSSLSSSKVRSTKP